METKIYTIDNEDKKGFNIEFLKEQEGIQYKEMFFCQNIEEICSVLKKEIVNH